MGPASLEITDWIGMTANTFLEAKLQGIKQMPYEKALNASSTHQHII